MSPRSGGDAHGERPPQLQSLPRSATPAPILNLPVPDLKAQGANLQAHLVIATKQPACEEIEHASPPRSVLHQPSPEAIPDPTPAFPATGAHPAASKTAAGAPSPISFQDPALVAVSSQIPAPAANVASPPTPRSASPALSPTAAPFYPALAGRSKALRWSDDGADGEEQVDYDFPASPSPRPATYCDVVRLGSPAAALPPPPPVTAPAFAATVPASGGNTGVSSVQRRRRRHPRHVRNRRVPPLCAVPPAQGAGGRPPVRARLGPRVPPARATADPFSSRRRPRVDADGFVEVISRSNRRRMQRATAAPSSRSSASSSSRRTLPPELRDRCLNCLSYNHRVASCRLPRRCLRCHGLRHLARECRRPRHPTAGTTTRNSSQLCSSAMRQDGCGRTMPQPRDTRRAGAGAGHGGGRGGERKRCHASPSPRPEHRCVLFADPSILLVRQREPPHQSMPDPMLIELQAAASPKLKMVVGQFEEAAQATTEMDSIVLDREPLPEELSQLSQLAQDAPEPEPAGLPNADGSSVEFSVGLIEPNSTPVAQEAPDQAAALGSFLNSIRVKVRPPLLPSPSMNHDLQDNNHGERTPTSDAGQDTDQGVKEVLVKAISPVRLPKRSERLANQKLSCVPVARRGEVILLQKFGMDQEVPFSGDARNAYNEVYSGKLDPDTRGAIKVLFPAGSAIRGRVLYGE